MWAGVTGDEYGGLTKSGLVYTDGCDDGELQPSPPLAEHVRNAAKDSELEASVELVLRVLERERL